MASATVRRSGELDSWSSPADLFFEGAGDLGWLHRSEISGAVTGRGLDHITSLCRRLTVVADHAESADESCSTVVGGEHYRLVSPTVRLRRRAFEMRFVQRLLS